MRNKLETVIVLIDQIIIIVFIITLVVIIKNIVSDKATSAESVSEQAIQVQQEPVSTSETAESTSETSEATSETSESVAETDSENNAAENNITSEQVIKVHDDVDESQNPPKAGVSIDLNSDPDISSGSDGFADPDGWEPASDDEMAWALDLAEKNGTVLH